MFKIEKQIPIPIRVRNSYPFGDMEVGDSFLVKNKRISPVMSAAYYWGKKHGVKFTGMTVNNGVRVWRIA